MAKAASGRAIRVGVLGVGRGWIFARHCECVGLELVALCDQWKEGVDDAAKKLNVTAYTDFEKFLAHDMDAVILSNYFHEKTPFAIRALQAGKHVMSETIPSYTMGEAVALVEAVEKSKQIYMFAENYPYLNYNQEMRRLYKAGQIGEFTYGEGEYVHCFNPVSANMIAPGVDHWRNWMPATYYSSHALAPIMYITETWPTQVSAFVLPHSMAMKDPTVKLTARTSDYASIMMVKMSNGAYAKLLQVTLRGKRIWTRIHGTEGQMENLRNGEWHYLNVRREQYLAKHPQPEDIIYYPKLPVNHELAMQHDGCDFFMNYHFAEAMQKNEQPFLDVYRAAAMSAVAIQGYRSALAGSMPTEVPDFHLAVTRRKFRNDNWAANPTKKVKGQPPCSIEGNVKPDPKGLAFANKIWKQKRKTYYALGE